MKHSTNNIGQRGQQGYILLITVVVVAAICTSIASTLLLLGIGTVRSSLAVEHGQKAKDLADACASEALKRLSLDTAYTGDETLTFDNGTCDVTQVSGTGDTSRTIQAVGFYEDSVKRVEVFVADVGPPMEITSWAEVLADSGGVL